jgi:hypothetical protein
MGTVTPSSGQRTVSIKEAWNDLAYTGPGILGRTLLEIVLATHLRCGGPALRQTEAHARY